MARMMREEEAVSARWRACQFADRGKRQGVFVDLMRRYNTVGPMCRSGAPLKVETAACPKPSFR